MHLISSIVFISFHFISFSNGIFILLQLWRNCKPFGNDKWNGALILHAQPWVRYFIFLHFIRTLKIPWKLDIAIRSAKNISNDEFTQIHSVFECYSSGLHSHEQCSTSISLSDTCSGLRCSNQQSNSCFIPYCTVDRSCLLNSSKANATQSTVCLTMSFFRHWIFVSVFAFRVCSTPFFC